MTKEEAINEIRSWDFLNEKESEAVQTLIPELSESEDERMYKAVRSIISQHYDRLMSYQVCRERRAEFVQERDEVLAYLEKQKEQKPILEVFGFKVGDAVRLKNGDGRKHIIKSFEEIEGVHGPNFYHVEFEDNSARDGIYPGEKYPNGYYTQMEKFEEEQKPVETSDFKTKLAAYLQNNSPKDGKYVISFESILEMAKEELIKRGELKEPKPSWKPSEEQMEALESATENCAYSEYQDCLRELIKQLKKRI